MMEPTNGDCVFFLHAYIPPSNTLTSFHSFLQYLLKNYFVGGILLGLGYLKGTKEPPTIRELAF